MVLVFSVLCYFYLDKTILNFNIAPFISNWFWQKKKIILVQKKLTFFINVPILSVLPKPITNNKK